MTSPITIDPSKITSADVQQEIRRVAKENPDFIYGIEFPAHQSECQYVVNGKGSCIVGVALINLGISPDTLDKHEHHWADTVMDRLSQAGELGEMDEVINQWIKPVQEYQGMDIPWAQAVKDADDSITP